MPQDLSRQAARIPEYRLDSSWHAAIVEAWDGLTYIGASDFRILFLNRRFIETLGRDATGEYCYAALHGRPAPCPWCPREVFSGKSVTGFFQRPDNSWCHVANTPLPLKDGSFAKIAFIRDSPEPESLVKNLPVFRNVLDGLSDAILFHALEDGRIVYANDLACRSFGLERENLLGRSPWPGTTVPGSPQDWRNLVAAIDRDGAAVFDSRYQRREAGGRDMEVKATRVRAGLDDFIVTVGRDITERKRVESRLSEERNKLDAIIDATGDGITVQDLDFRILYQNEVLVKRRGDRRGELCYRVYAGQEEICENCQARQSIADGQVHTRPFTTTAADGSPLYLEISACPLRDSNGEVTACVEVVRDMTAQRRLEGSREDAFSAVSHEMRTPLTAVLGFSQFLRENEVPVPQREQYLDLILKEGYRLKRLIDNLLSLQRLRAGFGLNEPGPVLLYPLLHEAAERYRSPLVSQQITIDCPPDLSPVLGETLRLSEALTNLLDNAVKYSPPQSTITLGAKSDGPMVRVTVGDEGPGIPVDKQELIFERFYRLQENRTPHGTGLGLALVREIAQAHGGRAWVESVPGAGSAFFLDLPPAG